MADISNTESRERVITGADGLNDLIVNPDGSINITGSTTTPISIIVSENSAARSGVLYWVNSAFINVATGVEARIILLKNPSGSGKVYTLSDLVFSPDENIGAVYTARIYKNPTITANGTTLTPVNARQTGAVATTSQVFSSPTISVVGTLVLVNTFTLSNNLISPGKLLLDPNNNYLFTLTTNNTANFNMTLSFSELVGI